MAADYTTPRKPAAKSWKLGELRLGELAFVLTAQRYPIAYSFRMANSPVLLGDAS